MESREEGAQNSEMRGACVVAGIQSFRGRPHDWHLYHMFHKGSRHHICEHEVHLGIRHKRKRHGEKDFMHRHMPEIENATL